MTQKTFFAHPFHGTLSAGRTHRLQAVEVAFLFADVVESTELAHRVGDRGAYSLIRRFCSLVRDSALELGGEALELRGDGALIAFADPVAALECASRIQRACTGAGEIAVRIGVHLGQALRLERGYFGQALILAGRLADQAKAGEILISDALRQSVAAPAALPVGAPRMLRLKGFAEPVRTFSLDWRADGAPSACDPFPFALPQPALASGW
jgi:class 3 adenylate cyclase